MEKIKEKLGVSKIDSSYLLAVFNKEKTNVEIDFNNLQEYDIAILISGLAKMLSEQKEVSKEEVFKMIMEDKSLD